MSDAQEDERTPPTLPCPRCREPLFPVRGQVCTLHSCGSCCGIWLDNEHAAKLAGQVDRELLALASRVSLGRASGSPERRAGVPCPSCSATMTVTAAPVGGVDVDVCNAHGTWFDKDELTAILAARAPRSRPSPRRAVRESVRQSEGPPSSRPPSLGLELATSLLELIAAFQDDD